MLCAHQRSYEILLQSTVYHTLNFFNNLSFRIAIIFPVFIILIVHVTDSFRLHLKIPKFHEVNKSGSEHPPTLKSHFIHVYGNMGFTRVYIIFRIFAQNIDCGCLLESPHCIGSNQHPQSIFVLEIRIAINFHLKNYVDWAMKNSIKIHSHVNIHVMTTLLESKHTDAEFMKKKK